MIWLIIYIIGIFIYIPAMIVVVNEGLPDAKFIDVKTIVWSSLGWPVIFLILFFVKLLNWLLE